MIRNQLVKLRVSEREKKQIVSKAMENNQNISEYIREKLCVHNVYK